LFCNVFEEAIVREFDRNRLAKREKEIERGGGVGESERDAQTHRWRETHTHIQLGDMGPLLTHQCPSLANRKKACCTIRLPRSISILRILHVHSGVSERGFRKLSMITIRLVTKEAVIIFIYY